MSGDVEIVPYRDGPYLVRGPVSLRDQDGRPISNSRRTIALCRCGKSQTRPFCDGTHRVITFRAASEAEAGAGAPDAPARRAPARRRPAQRPVITRTEVELARAERELRHLLAGAADQAGLGGPRTAAALLGAARRALHDIPPGLPAGAPARLGLAPCVCLVQGAMTALSGDPHDAGRRVLPRLQTAILQLSEFEDDDDH